MLYALCSRDLTNSLILELTNYCGSGFPAAIRTIATIRLGALRQVFHTKRNKSTPSLLLPATTAAIELPQKIGKKVV